MLLINDLEVMASHGLHSPFIASDSLYSPISDSPLMTHRIYPGLSSMVAGMDGSVACLFVDELPEANALKGVVFLTSREIEGEEQECWLIQLETNRVAWQFMTVDSQLGKPAGQVVLIQWRPGSLQQALDMHDAMIASMGESPSLWLIGSDLEKEAYSRFVLSSGLSSLAHPFAASGAIDHVIKNMGKTIRMEAGPCISMKAYEVEWFQVDNE